MFIKLTDGQIWYMKWTTHNGMLEKDSLCLNQISLNDDLTFMGTSLGNAQNYLYAYNYYAYTNIFKDTVGTL